MANRLWQESSPYLRQHANNPVDWYPWDEEALSKAKAENKPILLSIGYSACHWCHVMEHESFENDSIADLMNKNFVNIKVDREERPDLDQIYQNVAQLMTRSGGWPLTVFLTPDLKPFFGGTYFPPEDRHGRPGFPKVLEALSEAFKNDPNAIQENAKRLTDAIRQIESNRVEGHKRADKKSLRAIADTMISGVDWKNGGFGDAPKFPNTMNLSFLWRYGCATEFGMAQDAVTLALVKMAQGGIYDHLGGGFHRYSVDKAWSVPHFEKMLYDNACLLKLYSEVLLTAPKDFLSSEHRELFIHILEETVEYVLREMKAPEGGFYSTQDADSEGHEGKFFVWNPKTIAHALHSNDEAQAFMLRYGVSEYGNFENSGDTVLYMAMSVDDVARQIGKSKDQTQLLLASAKKKLFEAREKRIKPGRDEKILVSWNGLMVSGLVWAYRALSENNHAQLGERALQAAIVAMDFIRTHLNQKDNRLLSVYKDKNSRFNAYLDDYAFMTMAALDLSRVIADESEIEGLLAQAEKWTDVVRKHFADSDQGGYFFTSDDHEKLIQRPKTLYDQAIPSGNAVMAQNLLVLGEIFEGTPYTSEAEEILYKFFPTLEQTPFGMGELACAELMAIAGPIIVSGPDAHKTCFHPHVFQKLPADRSKQEQNSKVASHELLVCHKQACDLPYTEADAARKAIGVKLHQLAS